jgi:cell volume regulation protein A
MASLDSVSLAILLGSVLVMAGILSSLLALRFGAPLLLVFLVIGMLAGDSGPGQLQFDDLRTTYLVGSVALALILFDGGLRTRFQSIRAVLAPSMVLATVGVLLTALITAPVAKYALDLNWTEALLVGAVVASTDAAAVFLLVHAQGLRLRPRVGATLEAESGTNDPFAVFLTLMLVELISVGHSSAWHVVLEFCREAALGALIGVVGGRLVVMALNRVALPQGLHAPFVTTAALVIFGAAQLGHASGFLAVYLAGIIIGNRPTRAHNSVVTFLDAATWLAQIVMFVLLGLLVSPQRLMSSAVAAVMVALVLMLVARPIAVFLCLAPFRFNWREKMFIAWTGLRGAVAIFLASIPMLVGLSKAYLYFDVAFVVVIISLLLQGWTLAAAARRLHVALPRADRGPRRVELDLPGQLEQELVGYSGRLHLSAGAAGKGRGAGPLLCRHAAEQRARPASARRFHRFGRAHAFRTCRDLRRQGERGGRKTDTGRLFRRASRSRPEGGRGACSRFHRSGGAQYRRRPGQCCRIEAARGRGRRRTSDAHADAQAQARRALGVGGGGLECDVGG